jgi:hypothetical protein
MHELPIRFSALMVRAMLEGRKTATRRAISAQSEVCDHLFVERQAGEAVPKH